MELRRADLVFWFLRDRKLIAEEALRTPRRIPYAFLARVHSDSYLASLQKPETLGRIFAVDPGDVRVDELLDTMRLACGATLAAARESLATGTPALNLLGGFHHAGRERGGGFCAFNDIAVAVACLRADGFHGRVAVLDLDAHPPDGTADCFEGAASVWMGSLSGVRWEALSGVDETVLEAGTADTQYLHALAELLSRCPPSELVFVIAGGDVLADDRLGLLGLTLRGVRRRDMKVAVSLAGIPQVWLPGGGYQRKAWQALAGTALVLKGRPFRAIHAREDPLRGHFEAISRDIPLDALGGASEELTQGDVDEMFGTPKPFQFRLMGFYTAQGMEYALYRYGVLGQLERLGYRQLRVAIDATPTGDRMRLFGEAEGVEHTLAECVLSKTRLEDNDALLVNWLTLRNPRAHFSELRVPLPGQDVPGLGMAHETYELLGTMAKRLGFQTVAFRPSWFHMAYAARSRFRFLDGARQGRFEALLRDCKEVPLATLTRAVADGKLELDSAPYTWEPEEMVFAETMPGSAQWTLLRDAERERIHFTLTA